MKLRVLFMLRKCSNTDLSTNHLLCVYMCVFLCVCKQTVSAIIPQGLSTIYLFVYFRQDLPISLELTKKTRMACQWALKSAYLCQLNAVIANPGQHGQI